MILLLVNTRTSMIILNVWRYSQSKIITIPILVDCFFFDLRGFINGLGIIGTVMIVGIIMLVVGALAAVLAAFDIMLLIAVRFFSVYTVLFFE